jgi:hypothetical protein
LRLLSAERTACWYSTTPESVHAVSRPSRMRAVWRSIASVTIAGDGGSCWAVDSMTDRTARDEERATKAGALVMGVLKAGDLVASSDSLSQFVSCLRQTRPSYIGWDSSYLLALSRCLGLRPGVFFSDAGVPSSILGSRLMGDSPRAGAARRL